MKHAPRLHRVTPDEVRRLAADLGGSSGDNLDEMAVPTYTHANPLARAIFWLRHRRIMELSELAGTQRVLDFGTGTGALLPSLCAAAAVVHATDLNDAIARRLVAARGLTVRFHDPLALADSLDDASLDLVIAADVLEHVEEPQLSECLRIFHRKLAARGRLILSIPTETWLYRLGRAVVGFGKKGHYHRTGLRAIQRAASAAGFTPLARRSIPLPGPACLFSIVVYEKAS